MAATMIEGREADPQGRSDGAASSLASEHLVLVAYAVAEIAHRVPPHVTRDELEAAGMLGLVQAARSWDASRGIPFARYASPRIKGAVLDELRNSDWATRAVRARARALTDTAATLEARLGRPPTDREIARATHTDEHTVHRARADVARARLVSLDAVIGGGREPSPVDGGDPASRLLDAELRGYLLDAVAALPDRLRTIVAGYYFGDRRLQDIAVGLGVTPSRVSQLLTEALALLRAALDAHLGDGSATARLALSSRAARRRAAYVDAVPAASPVPGRPHRRGRRVPDALRSPGARDGTPGPRHGRCGPGPGERAIQLRGSARDRRRRRLDRSSRSSGDEPGPLSDSTERLRPRPSQPTL